MMGQTSIPVVLTLTGRSNYVTNNYNHEYFYAHIPVPGVPRVTFVPVYSFDGQALIKIVFTINQAVRHA